jgi:hypothetical protein
VLTGNCVVGERPAATLLFPYFEVDIANPSGTTTLFSVANVATGVPILARVTLWTEWGIPTVSFNLYLKSNDLQSFNLRDLFATGAAPATGPGAGIFPGCNDSIGGSVIPPVTLRAAHTGVKVFGACLSAGSRGPSVATGYVTVDAAARCPSGNGGGAANPSDGASYFSGGSRIAVTDNILWGDWFLVTPGQAFATGNPAVHIQADPDAFGAGDYTFSGAYVGFAGTDKRRPLPSRYRARFLQGGPFSGGTKLIAWRDTREDAPAPITCATGFTCAAAICKPGWFPLLQRNLTLFDQAGNSTNLGVTLSFWLATQRFDVSQLAPPYNFGYLDVDFDRQGPVPHQAWLGAEISAEGQYSLGYGATALNDLCAVSP